MTEISRATINGVCWRSSTPLIGDFTILTFAGGVHSWPVVDVVRYGRWLSDDDRAVDLIHISVLSPRPLCAHWSSHRRQMFISDALVHPHRTSRMIGAAPAGSRRLSPRAGSVSCSSGCGPLLECTFSLLCDSFTVTPSHEMWSLTANCTQRSPMGGM